MLAAILAILIPLAFVITRQHADSERQRTKAELSFLRSQINHHFLFNSLNNIYALSLQQSKHTSQAIYSLSSIMRHMATASATNKIELQQEINFIHHYIEIQKLRLSTNTFLSYDVQGDTSNKKIGPMLLIPFVENCFKHGVSTSKPSEIKIRIVIDDNHLLLETENTLISNLDNQEIKSGVGLVNVRKRLEYEYKGHYVFEQKEADGKFFSHFKLDLI
jgi:two-component system, LytTR family, sensor kinase